MPGLVNYMAWLFERGWGGQPREPMLIGKTTLYNAHWKSLWCTVGTYLVADERDGMY